MGDVVNGHFRTTNAVPVENVIEGAREADLGEILVLGWNKDNSKLYVAASTGNKPELLYLLELAKGAILQAE